MHGEGISFGQSINVWDYGLCATIHISTLPDGTWDCSERFEQEWNDMVRELHSRGYSPITEEPTATYAAPLTADITAEFEVYYVHRVASFAQYDLTALEKQSVPAHSAV